MTGPPMKLATSQVSLILKRRRAAEFFVRAKELAATTAGTPQTDSTALMTPTSKRPPRFAAAVPGSPDFRNASDEGEGGGGSGAADGGS